MPRLHSLKKCLVIVASLLCGLLMQPRLEAQKLDAVEVEGQPLAGNARRLAQALEFLGAPLAQKEGDALAEAIKTTDATKIQAILDPHVLVVVNLSPEAR